YDNTRFGVGIGVIALLVAVALGGLLAEHLSGPLRAIVGELEQVGRFKLAPAPVPGSFVHEITVMGNSVDRMKASLRSFSHYVPTELVRNLLASGQEAQLGGEIRQLTLHFSDIHDFTSISESLPPTELVQQLAEYLEVVTDAIEAYEGTVD